MPHDHPAHRRTLHELAELDVVASVEPSTETSVVVFVTTTNDAALVLLSGNPAVVAILLDDAEFVLPRSKVADFIRAVARSETEGRGSDGRMVVAGVVAEW